MKNTRGVSWILLLCSLSLACAATGLPDGPVLKDYDLKPWIAPLGSGLRVLVHEDHSAPVVTVVSVYGVGSTSDPKGVEGLAHFVEHLAFRSRPGGGAQYWDFLKRMGASFNASTSTDFTTYYTIAHKDNLSLMLQLEAWRLARTLDGVTPEIFTTEREVVRNELRQRWETTVGNRMFDVVLQALFPPTHPLARPIGGTHESLSAAQLSHAVAFVKEHYRPDNCTIVIAGDVDTAEVKQLLGKWPAEVLFGPAGPDGPAVPPRKRYGERPAPAVPAPHTRTLIRERGPIPQPQLVLGWSLPGAYRGHDALVRFAAARLNLALAEGLDLGEEDDIEGVGVSPVELADGSVMMMFASLKPGADPEKARGRLLDVLVHAWTTELGRMQTESLRWSTSTSLLRSAAEPVGKAISMAEHLGSTGRHSYFSESLEALAAVKENDVTAFAYKWLTRERAVAVYFEPENDEVPRLVGGGGTVAVRAQHQIGREESHDARGLGGEQILRVARPPGLGRLPRFKLANGLEVFAIKRGAAPVAQIELGIRGGDASVKPHGMASLATDLSRSLCRDHGFLSAVGGRAGTWTGRTRTSGSAEVLSGNLANGLAVLSDQVRCREVDEEVFLHLPRMLDRAKKDYERAAKRPEVLAAQRFSRALYPRHPYGETMTDPETLRGITREQAQGYVASHFRPGNAVVVVHGDIEPEEVRGLAERYFGLWPAGGGDLAAIAPPLPPPPEGRSVFLVNRPRATQAMVNVGCRLAAVVPERRPAYDLVEELASERAWSVREQWGATYGIHANVALLPGGAAHLVLEGAVENAQAGKSVAQLLTILEELGAGKIDESLFLVKRWDVARGFSRRFAQAGAMAEAILTAATHGWPLDVYDRYPERLAATTPEGVRKVMEGCVGREVVTVVGDASVLRPQLEAVGLTLTAE